MNFSQDILNGIFPSDRADQFFDALFGDTSEGAYDIVLVYSGETEDSAFLFITGVETTTDFPCPWITYTLNMLTISFNSAERFPNS